MQETIGEQESPDGGGKSLNKVVMAIEEAREKRQSTKTNK